MKIITAFLFICSLLSHGQSFYAGLRFGISEGIASDNITTEYVSNAGNVQQSIIKGSFGRGTSVYVDFGYKISQKWAIEILISDHRSFHYKGCARKDLLSEYKSDISANMQRAALSIKCFIDEDKWSPYVRFAPVFRLFGSIKAVTEYKDLGNDITTTTALKQTNGFSIGFLSGIGFARRLNEKLSFTIDLSAIAQSWAPANGDVISYSVNGVDQMETLKFSQKHIHYVKTTNSSNYSAYKPLTSLKQYHPFSSIGVNVGLIYSFGKKNEKET